jgi:hypothetical protein
MKWKTSLRWMTATKKSSKHFIKSYKNLTEMILWKLLMLMSRTKGTSLSSRSSLSADPSMVVMRK